MSVVFCSVWNGLSAGSLGGLSVTCEADPAGEVRLAEPKPEVLDFQGIALKQKVIENKYLAPQKR